MFGFNKKKDEEQAPEVETAEAPEATEATEATEAPTSDTAALEQAIDARNGEIARLQLLLGQIRENAARQEQQALTALSEARAALTNSVRELGAAQGVQVDDGGKWNFDLTTKTFSKAE